jgi:hypothetical protein
MDQTELAITILSTFLATFLGVIFAFELERYRDAHARKERLVGALRMIRDEIEKNVALCKQIENELSLYGQDYVQFYNVKTTTWESVSSALVDLKPPELAKQIATEYYEYEHLKRKIDARFEFFRTPTPFADSFAKMTSAVVTGVRDMQKSGSNLLIVIDKQLKELS